MRLRSASSTSTTGLRLYWSLHHHVPRDRRPPRCGSIRLAFAGFGSEQFVLCGRARAAGKLHVYPTDMCNAWLIAEGRSLTLTGGPLAVVSHGASADTAESFPRKYVNC